MLGSVPYVANSPPRSATEKDVVTKGLICPESRIDNMDQVTSDKQSG